MTGWETLSDAIATDSDAFGGAYLNRITQLLIGTDIAAGDATLKPLIGTDWRFKSGHLYLNDANEDHTLQILPDNQTQNVVVKFPVQSYTPDYVMLRTQSETIQNKVIDAGQNTLQNITNASIAAAAGIVKSKLATLGIVDADVTAHTTSKITTTTKALLNTQIAYKDENVWLTDAMVAANAAIAKTKLAALAIVDADVSAHTSTKITITDKSHLPADIDYINTVQTLTQKTISGASNTITNIPDNALSANIDFLNTPATATALDTFLTNCLGLRNPANTYTTTLNSGATGANITLTLPILAGDALAGVGSANAFTGANTFNSFSMNDAQNIAVGSGTGTKIGTATTQKIGFYNKAPVAQAGAIATPTSDTVGTKAAIDAIRTALINLGLTA